MSIWYLKRPGRRERPGGTPGIIFGGLGLPKKPPEQKNWRMDRIRWQRPPCPAAEATFDCDNGSPDRRQRPPSLAAAAALQPRCI
ncbi:hypothetical protein JCGZ_18143 [Jatropha curcas]|uniref:Uncharacterized protein n=1 Tax=Jatropha curcas TaxID=180498 RepID=A0A067KDR5_JATCU|nr:hypothetical protein JCGZ_18143 [Jatropha curcas]